MIGAGFCVHFLPRQNPGEGSDSNCSRNSGASVRANTDDLLKRFQLRRKTRRFLPASLRRSKVPPALAMALVNNPQVVFLDEPTAGLDPQVRREIYDIIEELKHEKKTVLLTTHYIEEAERLCDRVAIIDYGRVIKTGTPRELKHTSAGTTRIEVRLAKPVSDGVLAGLTASLTAASLMAPT